MKLRANAKINLYLRVERPRRADGFHEIETIFHSVGLSDELDVDLHDDLRLTVVARGVPHVPHDRGNLVVRAAERLRGRAGVSDGASLRLVKRIPAGAGLGGGSADAAAALVALDRLWKLDLSDGERAGLAAEIGSDVPFCLLGGTARGRGRGELLEPIQVPEPFWFVLGISDEPLSTAEVYARFDEGQIPESTSSGPVLDALRGGRPEDLGARLLNDLARAAIDLRPELVGAIETMIRAGAFGATVSGSGPTVFGVAASEPHAREVAARTEDAFDRVEVVASRPRGVEI